MINKKKIKKTNQDKYQVVRPKITLIQKKVTAYRIKTSRTDSGSHRMKQRLHGSTLGPLHTWYGCIVKCFGGMPNSGCLGVCDSFVCSLDTFPPPPRLLSPTLIWWFVPSIITTCYVIFGWYSWEACYLWGEMEEQWIWEGRALMGAVGEVESVEAAVKMYYMTK